LARPRRPPSPSAPRSSPCAPAARWARCATPTAPSTTELIGRESMDLGISGRRAAVAAASRGLGYATAAALAAEGVHVAICGRDENAVAVAADRIGERAVPLVADVSTAEGAISFVEGARNALGGIDILVTNAGGPPPGDFSSTELDQYLTAFELNC